MKNKLFAVFCSVVALGSGVLAGGCGDSGSGITYKDASPDKPGDSKGGASGEVGGAGGTTSVIDAGRGGATGTGGLGAGGAGGADVLNPRDVSPDISSAGGGSGGISNGGAGGTAGVDGGHDVATGGDARVVDARETGDVVDTRVIDLGPDLGRDLGIDGGIDVGVCTPGTHQCSGNAVQTCTAAEQWGAAAACAFPTPKCSAGACVNATLAVTKVGAGSGTVVSDPTGLSCGATCSRTFTTTPVVLNATAAAGSTFTGWSGAGCSGTGTCSVSLTAGDAAVTATFALVQYTLTVTKAGSGTGTVTSTSPTGITCGATCSAAFDTGTSVVLRAAAATGSTFEGWSGGGCTGTAATCTVTMSAATTVNATFSLPSNTLTIVRDGSGSGTVASSPAGINCGGAGSCSADFDPATSVTLTAAPATGSAFTGWSGGGCTGVGTCVLSVTADTTVTATFAPVVSCTTVKATAGTCTGGTAVGGTISASDYGSCHDKCQTAMAVAGTTSGCWLFNGTTCTCRSGNLSTTAGTNSGGTCADASYALTVTKAGTGDGEVTSGTAIACGTNGTKCSALYATGDDVVLTANAAPGSSFTSWSGVTGTGCAGNTGTCTVSMIAARNVTATFTLSTNRLTVTKNGSGTGTVVSTPPGINCGTGTACYHSFDYNTDVTLLATPDAGSQFAGWMGCTTSTGTTCHVTVTEATTVFATFAPPLGCTTVQTASNSACSTDPTTPVERDLGTSLSAQQCHDGCETAMAAAGMQNGCWVLSGNQHCYCRNGSLVDGGGSSPGGKCAASQHSLNVTLVLASGGSGSVASIPTGSGISCGTECSALFPTGSGTVTLAATPASDSTFAGWSGGACTGTNTTCAVSMTADLDVTATFVVPLNCGAATTTIATCPNGTVAEVTPTAASAGACRTQCATQMAAKEMASGCWYFQNNTCHCRSGQATTGTTLTGGSCS